MKKKKMIVLCLMLVLALSVSARGLKFEAPMINGKTYVDTPTEGEILLDTSDNKFYGYVNSSWVDLSASGGSSIEVCYIVDAKSAGTNGGSFTSGTWHTRDLTDISGDTSWCSLSTENNQFTLAAGKYAISASALGFRVDKHKLKIQNITDSTTEIIGLNAYSAASNNYAATLALLEGSIVITGSKTFELQHRSTASYTTYGFGNAANIGVNEIYSQIKIIKL